MTKTRVLVVEDEPKIVHLVREILSAAGFEVLAAVNGERAIEMTALEQPDIVILDIVLSKDMDGFETARRIRKFSEVPIIILTARVRESDLLQGFDVGADDYLTKPFSAKELLARIKAVLKRSHVAETAHAPSMLVCGDLIIDMARHRVTRGEQEINLTPTEYNLLCELARHPNQVLVHEHLLTAVWGPEYRNDSDYLRAYIRYLRKKVEEDPAHPRYILRCPGVGYTLVCGEPPAC